MEEEEYEQGQQDGEEGDDGIRIQAPREPEVNPDVYQNTVELISRGFLMVPVDIGDVPFVFKSLNHHEFERVRLLSGFLSDTSTVPARFWDLFLAYMVLFVDGENILTDRSRWIPRLVDTFRDLPIKAKSSLVRQLSDLNRKSAQAAILVEPYATETYSRWRWAQVQGLDLSSPSLTGIEGTEKVGLSYAQLAWRAINYFEDLRHRQDVDWENAKFIGGCFAGKGIQKIYNQDRDRHQKERQARWNRKDQLLRHVVYGDPLESDKKYGGAQVVIVASTVEELAEQVEKSLRGEKDWHDEIVQEYEDNIRRGVRKKQEQLTELVEARDVEMGGKDTTGTTQFAGLSRQQVEAMIQKQRKKEAEARASSVAPLANEEMVGKLDKWGFMEPMPSTNRPTDGAIPLQSRRNTGKPWRPR